MGKKALTFWGHLEELRWVFMRVVGIAVIFMVAYFFLIPYIFDNFILAPTTSDFFLYKWLSNFHGGRFMPDFSDTNYSIEIINLRVTPLFMTHISLSLYFSIITIFPYLIIEVWRFIRPAMHASERRSFGFAFLFATFMFYLGCAVGYALVFPFSFRFLTEYSLGSLSTNQITLSSYMSVFMTLIFVMGLVFELPLLTWLLSKLGLISGKFLRKHRKHAIVILLILAAVITPTSDPFTLMIVFVPLYLLYELGIVFCKKEVPRVEVPQESE